MNIQLACLWEVLSRKVGNIHPQASFHNTTYYDFLLSGLAIDAVLEGANDSIGQVILQAVQATHTVVRQNTNLGIILLLAPLAICHQQSKLAALLQHTTVGDSEAVYQAIRIAQPRGLGVRDQEDIRQSPTLPLVEVMKFAADRDMIARQYANNFSDVINYGVPKLLEGYEVFKCIEAAVIHCQFCWLAEFPDSLIVRKVGHDRAISIQQLAKAVQNAGGIGTTAGRSLGIELDRFLRSDGNLMNPGTTADLVTACLYVALQDGTLTADMPFFWKVPDWL